MKRYLSLFALILFAFSITGCHKVPQGFRAVRVHTLGSDKGDIENIGPGRYGNCTWAINIECYNIPTTEIEYVWTAGNDEGSEGNESITFQDKNGLVINGDFGIRYFAEPDAIDELYARYRMSIEELTDTKLRNMVRDGLNSVASTMSVEQIYGEGKVGMMEKVQETVQEQVAGILDIEKVYIIGDFRFDDKIKGAISEKIASTQRAQQREFELRETEAQAAKDSVEAIAAANVKRIAADAEAYYNLKVTQSLSPTYVEYIKAKAWDGKMPQVTGSGGTIIDLK